MARRDDMTYETVIYGVALWFFVAVAVVGGIVTIRNMMEKQ